jgi:conjugal transfer pilus assembly protein TraW
MRKTRVHIKIILVIIFAIIVSIESEAKDFGKQGNTFEIKEEGFLSMVQRKLNNVDIEEHKKKMQSIARRKIEEPDLVKGIVSTLKPRNFEYDPTFIVKEDITLQNGEVLYPIGTKVNPLDHMDFDRKLFFIDGRDKDQIKWLLKSLHGTEKVKYIILVAGRPLDLSEELGLDVYFDQFGELTTKFGIKQVPATVEQEKGKKVLSINEIKYESNS